jgi:hypothetical protein
MLSRVCRYNRFNERQKASIIELEKLTSTCARIRPKPLASSRASTFPFTFSVPESVITVVSTGRVPR